MQIPITPLLDRIVIEKENIKESKSGIVLTTSDNDTLPNSKNSAYVCRSGVII